MSLPLLVRYLAQRSRSSLPPINSIRTLSMLNKGAAGY